MKTYRLVALLICLTVAVPLFALQRGSDSITGTWTGDWGPSPGDRNTVSVDLKSNGKTVTGVVHSINFQRPDVMLEKSTFDSSTGAVHMEADASTPNGKVHYVIDGKVANGMMMGS